jgi:type I restriction enzyme S subunit
VTDVLDFRGRTPKKLGMDWGGGKIPALSAVNVRDGAIDLNRTTHFGSDALYRQWMTKGHAARGDILITTEAPLGNIAQVPDDDRYILSQRVILLKPRRDVVEPAFLALQMRGAEFQSALDDNRSGTTATGIRQARLVTLPIHLPPLNEQRRIVAKLETLQARSRRAREALDAVPPLLEKLRQAILAAAFRGDLTEEWRAKHPDVEPATELLKRIRIERRKKWEEAELAKMKAKGKAPADDRWMAKYREPEPVDASGLPELPEGWCWVAVDELLQADGLAYGVLKPGERDERGVPMIRVMDIGDGCLSGTEIIKISPKLAREFGRTRLEAGDVLLTVMASIGRTMVVPASLSGANVNRAVAVLKPVSRDPYSEYLSWYFRSPEFRRAFVEKQLGSAQQRINLSDVARFVVPIPSAPEMPAILGQIAKRLTSQVVVETATNECVQQLAVLEQSVLARAFRGELVPQDPNDEPAEALLARLRAADSAPEKPRPRRRRSEAAE